MEPITVDIYSHHFVIRDPDTETRRVLYGIASDYTTFTTIFDKATKKQKWVPDKTFAICVGNGSEFRFHIGQLNIFLDCFRHHQLKPERYKITYHTADPGVDAELTIREKWVLYPDQIKAKNFALAAYKDVGKVDGAQSPLLSMPTGTGKPFSLETPVRTPDGWQAIGELKLGDEVIGQDGLPTMVTEIFDQGVIDLYRITFSDGRWVDCGDEHLWRVYDYSEKPEGDVISTNTIRKLLGVTYDMGIDYPEPEMVEKQHLTIMPYVFGIWLTKDISHLGRRTRIIHEEYKQASPAQRFDLMRGVCDENAVIAETAIVLEFDYEKTALDVVEMARSLGSWAKLEEITTNEASSFVVSIRDHDPARYFTSLEKKKAAIRATLQDKYLKIKRVEAIRPGEARCISIDNEDRLFVVKDYIVSHNTVTSSFVCAKIQKRICIFVLSRFVDKWISDVKEIYEVTDKDICVIKDGKALMDASHWAQDDPKYPMPKIFIISINTFDVWVSKYSVNPFDFELEQYGCQPYEFMEHLGIGTVLIDEAHMHLFMVFRIFCYLHVPFVLSLSATMRNKNMIIQRVQRTLFPRNIRFEEIKMKEYITCHACSYQITNFAASKVQINEYGKNTYSHNAFERSILKHKKLGPQYVKMIVDMVINNYHRGYMEGDKCLVFVAKKETAIIVRDAIRQALPDYITNTYLQEDKLDQLLSSDISVSTVLSSGTALDIPNLRHAILTISIDSEQANLQALGRLRELKDRDVSYWYLYCNSIPKQVDYHNNKKELFRGRLKSHNNVILGTLYA